ncbi:MAG: hypothetical protein VYB38_04565 [Bacteroidota bacterium]|nr:hypothetical protein [Bacteroidota bacterium]
MEIETKNNINKILGILLRNKQSYGSLRIEHLGDLINLLEKHDRKRDLDGEDLRKILLILSKNILEKKLARINFELAYNYIYPPPSDSTNYHQIEKYIEDNWNKMNAVDRQCLISFEI